MVMGSGQSVSRGRGPVPRTQGSPVFPDPLTSTKAILVSSTDMKGKSLFLYFPVLIDQDFFRGGLHLLEFPWGGRGCSWAGNGETFAKLLCKRLSEPVLWAGPDKTGLEGKTHTTFFFQDTV